MQYLRDYMSTSLYYLDLYSCLKCLSFLHLNSGAHGSGRVGIFNPTRVMGWVGFVLCISTQPVPSRVGFGLNPSRVGFILCISTQPVPSRVGFGLNPSRVGFILCISTQPVSSRVGFGLNPSQSGRVRVKPVTGRVHLKYINPTHP